MSKKLLSILLITITMFSLSLPNNVLASTTSWTQSGKPKYIKESFGKWENQGSTFQGPGTMKKKHTTKTTFTVEPQKNVPRKVRLLNSFGINKTISTEASKYIPKKKKGQFQTRNYYQYYKIQIQEIKTINGIKIKTNNTKSIIVKKKAKLQSKIVIK